MTLATAARRYTRPPNPEPLRLAEAHVDPIYRRWAEQLIGDAGRHLAEPGHHLDTDPAFVFDGAGDRALRFLIDRGWAQNSRTVVYTLHAHPIWHAALASTGAHIATWPTSASGIALAAARAAQGDVRTLPPAPIKGAPARVAARLLIGKSTEAIADELGISTKTANHHASAVMAHCSDGPRNRGTRRTTALLEIANAYYTGGEA